MSSRVFISVAGCRLRWELVFNWNWRNWRTKTAKSPNVQHIRSAPHAGKRITPLNGAGKELGHTYVPRRHDPKTRQMKPPVTKHLRNHLTLKLRLQVSQMHAKLIQKINFATTQGYHRLSGSSRWTTPAWKPNILSTVITHTYIDAIAITITLKLNSDLYELSKIITLSTKTPSMAKTHTGMMSYTTKVTCPTQKEDDPVMVDNTLSWALIELWQPNFEVVSSDVDTPNNRKTTRALPAS